MAEQDLAELVKTSKAQLLVLLQREVPEDRRVDPQILLSRAGFNGVEIAALLGKTTAAVQKYLHRAGKA